MTPEEAIQVADEVLLAHAGNPLTDIQRLILRESLAGKGYERMEGYAPQHIKNEGQKLWGLLSKALGQKVSKTSFEGALEKRWKLGELIPKPPLLSVYNPQMWVGRKAILSECLPKLRGQARVLWITGISGIGKTALGECLASQAWEGDPSFQWLYLEILEGQSPEFVSVAADLLAKLGDVDLDPQERNDPKRLMERLLRKLNVSRYWLQVDSLERLLSSEQPTETKFADQHWVTFLQRCLTEPIFASRLVLTAQALPSSLAELEDRYPNLWQVITLQGLVANQQDAQQPNEHLKLFAKNDLSVDDISAIHLRRIGQIYEGHPLVLQVIAKEILAAPFAGSVAMYWERYGNEFEQVTRELQVEWVSPELYNQALQRRVRRRVEVSLKRLPTEAFDLLCRSSVYRRPVPENFWLSLLEEHPSQLRQQAYQILNERALIEREGIHQNQFLIRQHNLVRAVAYDLLKADPQRWHQSERQAAHLWLTAYKSASDAPKLETMRGYLEAFDHYCEVEDWVAAKKILLDQQLGMQLQTWGNYQDIITRYHLINDHLIAMDGVNCKRELGNTYLCICNYSQAIYYYKQSLNLAWEIGDALGKSKALGNLGFAYDRLGEYKQAIDFYQQRLTIAREISHRLGESNTLGNLGLVYYKLGKYEQAINFYQEHLTIAREIGHRLGEGNTLSNLGLVYYKLGEYGQAISFYQEHLTIAQEIGDKLGEGNALNHLGAAQIELKQYPNSIKNLGLALEIFCGINARNNLAEALKNLAKLHQALGELKEAQQYCQQALGLATELGIPLAEECQKLKEELEARGASEGK
jgi:tetratricopeptide (TPR) repeat protein